MDLGDDTSFQGIQHNKFGKVLCHGITGCTSGYLVYQTQVLMQHCFHTYVICTSTRELCASGKHIVFMMCTSLLKHKEGSFRQSTKTCTYTGGKQAYPHIKVMVLQLPLKIIKVIRS